MLDGLFFLRVHWSGLVLCPIEVDAVQVDAADATVVHRAEVDAPALHIRGRGPLCRTGDVGRYFAVGKFDAYGYVEVVQYLEALAHGLRGRGGAWR